MTCWASGHGVSPSAAAVRTGAACHALVCWGEYGRDLARQGPQTVARRASALPAILMDGLGAAECGLTGQTSARSCRARSGKGCRRQRGGSQDLPRRLHWWSWQAPVREGTSVQGRAGQGAVRSGLAKADDLSTEPFGALCWVLWNPVLARHGAVGPGKAGWSVVRQGTAELGGARQGLQTAARSFYGGSLLLSMRAVEAGPGLIRHGWLRQRTAWCGMA